MAKKTHAEYLEELIESNSLFAAGAFVLLSEYQNAKTAIECRCTRCDTVFRHRPDHLKRYGCPKCDGDDKGPKGMTHERFLEKLAAKNQKYADGDFEVVGKYGGSQKPIACRCSLHGEWKTIPSSLLRGTGCPKCANRMTADDFFAKLSRQNDQFASGDIEITSSFVDHETRIGVHCLVCDHSWNASPGGLLSNHGCPNFRRHPGWTSPKTITEEEFLSQLAEKHPDIELLSNYENMTKLLEVRCRICGHKWFTNGTKLITLGQGCSNWRSHPGYKSPKRKKHDAFIAELFEHNEHYADGEFEVLTEYDGIDNHVECHCLVCDNNWSRNAYDLIHNGSGCPECSAKQRGLATRKTHDRFLEELAEANEYYSSGKIEIVGKYESSKVAVACHCLVCGNDWEALPDALIHRGAGCPRCSRSGTSRVEQVITVALEMALGEDAVLNRDKTAIGAELDIYVPARRLAVEYGSWFWHESRFENDLDKIEKCRDSNITLITIYDQCREPISIEIENVKTYPFDLWSEKGQPALKELVTEILSTVGSNLSFSDDEWKSLRVEASSRTVLRTTDDFKEELRDTNEAYAEGKFDVIGEYTGNHNKIDCVCNECGYRWSPEPSALLNGSGCPSCAGNLRKDHDEVVAEVARHNPDIEVIGEYRGASTPFLVRCRICGHEWNTTTGQIRQNKGCPKYRQHPGFVDPTARTQDDFRKAVQEANPDVEPLGEYKNANTKVPFRCKKCGYEWSTKPAVIINLGGGCPKCAGRTRLTHEEFLEKLSAKNADYTAGKFDVVGKYVNSKTKIECRCHEHGTWNPTPGSLLHGSGCPECGVAKCHAPKRADEKSGSRRLRTHQQFLDELKEKNTHYAAGEFEVLGVYTKSVVPIECSCPEHGRWSTTPSNLIHNNGKCPRCGNDAKRITHDEFLKRLAERNPHYAAGEFEVTSKYTRSKDDIECTCPKHGPWKTKANTLMNGTGCPKCSSGDRGDSRRKTHQQFLEDLAAANSHYAAGEFDVIGSYTDSRLPIECKCPQHGSWLASYKALMYGSGCPRCVSLAHVDPDLAAQWHPVLNGDLTPWDVKPGSSKNVWWKCGHGHEWQQRIDRRYYGKAKCPQCRRGAQAS